MIAYVLSLAKACDVKLKQLELFKTFMLDKEIKIQEFKVKDATRNWRAVSCIIQKDVLVFVYAFHKKSQGLLEKDKNTIRKRIKRIEL